MRFQRLFFVLKCHAQSHKISHVCAQLTVQNEREINEALNVPRTCRFHVVYYSRLFVDTYTD